MLSLLRPPKPVANDVPKPARRAALVIIREQPQRLFWMMAAGIACLVLIVSGIAFWVMHDARGLTETALTPATYSAANMPASAQTAPAKPVVAVENPDLPNGIALPAETLGDPHRSAAAAPDPATIAFVAEKMGQRPITGKTEQHPADENAGVADIIIDESDSVFTGKPRTEKSDAEKAASLMDSGDYSAALTTYNNVLDHDPGNRPALRGKARALHMLGDDDAAMDMDRAILSQASGDTLASRPIDHPGKAAQSEPGLMTTVDAGDLGEDSSTRAPDLAAAHATAARAALSQGNTDLALTHFDRAVRLAPGNIPYRLGLAIAYDSAGQNAAALGVYRQVLSLLADQDEPSRWPLPIGSIRARVSYLENLVMP